MLLVHHLKSSGAENGFDSYSVEASEATFYLWIRAARGDDVGLVERMLRAGLVALPGSFLGAGGEGFVRWALVPTLPECRDAITRLESVENG